MALQNEESKDSNEQEKDKLDTYDLFRLNLIMKPDGSTDTNYDE